MIQISIRHLAIALARCGMDSKYLVYTLLTPVLYGYGYYQAIDSSLLLYVIPWGVATLMYKQ